MYLLDTVIIIYSLKENTAVTNKILGSPFLQGVVSL